MIRLNALIVMQNVTDNFCLGRVKLINVDLYCLAISFFLFVNHVYGKIRVYTLYFFTSYCNSVVASMLCYHSSIPRTCKDDINASAICHL